MTIQVLCLLVTHTCEVIGNAFRVSVPNSDRVPDLLEEVNEKASPLIDGKHLAADALTPWKPHSFFPAHPPAHLARHVNDLFLNDEDKCAASRLENGVTQRIVRGTVALQVCLGCRPAPTRGSYPWLVVFCQCVN